MEQEEPTGTVHSQEQITAEQPQQAGEEKEAAAAKEEEESSQEQEGLHHRQPRDSGQPKANFTTKAPTSRNALAFWAYLTLGVTLLTILLSSFHSTFLRNLDDSTWFLSLPDELRLHYSSGRLIKDHHHSQAQIFTLDRGPRTSETVLLLHGLAATSFSFRRVAASLADRGLRVVAPDLPGTGFSDALPEAAPGGLLSRVLDILRDVREKGIFWGFDQLVEKGFIEYEEKGRALPENTNLRYGPEEVAVAVGRVVEELGLGTVHLVLHDSAVGAGTRWAAGNPEKVRSVSFIDTSSVSAAFPSWMFGTPLLREVLLGFRPAFRGLLRLCCARGIGDEAAEAYRMMLKGSGRRRGLVEHGRGLNYSFDFGEWVASEELKGLPMLVLWSHAWTDLWINEGRRVSIAVPNSKFVQHFGGRWAQEDAAEEIVEKLAEFVLSLPKSNREVKLDPPFKLGTKMVDKANEGGSPHDHHNHDHAYENVGDYRYHGHDPEPLAGLKDAYGLNI